jgi:hypothetical protein
MPYLSPQERNRQRWMTLRDAILHIRRVDKCDQETALHQLRAALADGEVQARWGSGEIPQFVIPIVPGAVEVPAWALQKFWLSVPIDLTGAGSIPALLLEELESPQAEEEEEEDEDDDDNEGSRLTRYFVFVLREDIERHWPSDHPETRAKGPVTASSREIEEVLRKIYDEAEEKGEKPPNINQAADLAARKLQPKKVPRKVARVILDKAEFKRRRPGPGRRRLEK